MRKVAQLIALFSVGVSMMASGAALAFGGPPLGLWETPDMDAIIDIRPCGERLCAELTDHDYHAVADRDINNPDPAKRDRPLLGVGILSDLERTGDDRWGGGVLYDPRTGKSYSSRLRTLDDEHIRITACIGPGLCKGYVWTRVNAIAGRAP